MVELASSVYIHSEGSEGPIRPEEYPSEKAKEGHSYKAQKRNLEIKVHPVFEQLKQTPRGGSKK